VNLIKLKPAHYFGFLYVAFAHLTDGKYKRVEQLTIWQSVSKWLSAELKHGDYTCVMDEVMEWYKNKLHDEDFENEVFEIVECINDFSWFSKQDRIESLTDLKHIAVSDKRFLKKEKLWIRKIGTIWGLNLKEIENIINS
jgi:hypothetical protein